MRIYFLGEFSVCCNPDILLPWQCDVTTSPFFGQVSRNQLNASGKTARYDQAYKTGTPLEVKLIRPEHAFFKELQLRNLNKPFK